MTSARRECGAFTLVHDEERRPGSVRVFETKKARGGHLADLSPRDAEYLSKSLAEYADKARKAWKKR